MATMMKVFEEAGVSAEVYLLTGNRKGDARHDAVQIQGNVICIPNGLRVTGFRLVVYPGKKVLIVQKDIGTENGAYYAVEGNQGIFGANYTIRIPVVCENGMVRTPWHEKHTNRLDCWTLEDNGHIELYQIGIVTPDNGRTFRLLCRPTWKGQLYQNEKKIVSKPDEQQWGPFDNRRMILNFPAVKDRLQQINLHRWNGTDEDLNPPLGPVPEGDYARMKWWNEFAGAGGQGIAILSNRSSAWVCANNLRMEHGPEGVKILCYNDLLSFQKKVPFGKRNGEKRYRLLGVKKV